MPSIPDEATYRETWSSMDFSHRRTIVKAVNKGRACETREDAAIAVVVARRQQRFWKYAWLMGPLVALIQVGEGLAAYLVNAALATIIVGGMAWWKLRRVRQAEDSNLTKATGGTDRGGRDHVPKKRSDGHLPPNAKGVRPGAGDPKPSRRDRKG